MWLTNTRATWLLDLTWKGESCFPDSCLNVLSLVAMRGRSVETFVEVTMDALSGRRPERSRKSRRLDTNSEGDLLYRESTIHASVDVVERCLQEILRKSSSFFGGACLYRIVLDEVHGQSFDQ